MIKNNLIASQKINNAKNKIFNLIDKDNQNQLLRTHINAILDEAIYPLYEEIYILNKKIKDIERRLNINS